MYRIAFAYLKQDEDALEAIQETTYRAWKTFRKLREPSLFATWLTRILLNVCNDEWKRKRRWAGADRLPEEAGRSSETDVVERLRVEAALERLEPNHREVVVLKYYEDLTLTEIARSLERPEGTVKTWLHKALTRLRAIMTEEEARG
ncbi:sigma-70 family RNA polymerase sigma factor [Paenibacillus sp. TRM 82003]|nr:sigma-70 family RNA polymerase sigma factor [Paenibacillus sp. TRM 82003]